MASQAKIDVTLAGADDFDAIKEILHETYVETWLPELSKEAARSHETANKTDAYVERRGLKFWVAKNRDQALGLVDFEGNFVYALHVRPSFARRGIGNRLMDKAEFEIKNRGFSNVRLETETFNRDGRAFYEARHYREIDRYPDKQWDSGLTTLLLEKQLV